jgi:hypothetical protein
MPTTFLPFQKLVSQLQLFAAANRRLASATVVGEEQLRASYEATADAYAISATWIDELIREATAKE